MKWLMLYWLGDPRSADNDSAINPEASDWLHWENYISISFHIEKDMIVVTVFYSILNQMEFYLVQNGMETCHHDHILFNVKGNGNIVFSVYAESKQFLNLAKLLNQIRIAISLFRLICHQTELHLVTNRSEKYNHNPSLVSFSKL